MSLISIYNLNYQDLSLFVLRNYIDYRLQSIADFWERSQKKRLNRWIYRGEAHSAHLCTTAARIRDSTSIAGAPDSRRGRNRYARPRVTKTKRISVTDDDDDDDDDDNSLTRDGRSRRLCNAIIDSGGVQRRRKEQHRSAVLVPTTTNAHRHTPRRPYRGASR